MPSQQLEANAFTTDHYGSMKNTGGARNRIGCTTQEKHEKVENHSLASMSTRKIIMIFKNKKCEQTIGKEGALARHVLGGNRFMPARSPPPPPPKKNYMVASESPSPESSDPLSDTNAEDSVS